MEKCSPLQLTFIQKSSVDPGCTDSASVNALLHKSTLPAATAVNFLFYIYYFFNNAVQLTAFNQKGNVKNMKFKCNRNKLHEVITNVSRAVPAKSNIAALEGIKLSLSGDTLEVTGYDLAFGIRSSINVESEDSGELVVNARLFAETIRRMSSDDIEITIDEKTEC